VEDSYAVGVHVSVGERYLTLLKYTYSNISKKMKS